jgi:uncharacterized protein (DUF4415 family)
VSVETPCFSAFSLALSSFQRNRIPRNSYSRITIRLDNEVIDWFRTQVNDAGGGNYQSLINEALKGYVKQRGLETTLRRLIREELRRVA